MSALLGSVFPLGWLWATIKEAAFARRATLKTSRGETMQAVRAPMWAVWMPISRFWAVSMATAKCSRSHPSR